MYDFCFTPFYAMILAIGGLVGYATKGSLPSLGAGLGSAFALVLLTFWSYKTFMTSRRKATLAVLGSLGIAVGLAGLMGKRYSATGGAVPGSLACVSGLMVAYYCFNLIAIPSVAPKPGHGKGGERPAAKRGGRLHHA
uniref:Transmembrane protein 14C n=1 Tax=Dunaliella tertiolecta TaxID=3047 RepID=A0A7S3QM10_DUNTE|mmetsp:Transcript_1515/g.3670  ORF Transcript_1515/g.3670 Transcript_1515/m.3670 type:complete len:138 (-) Transcript_1515:81-494(-)